MTVFYNDLRLFGQEYLLEQAYRDAGVDSCARIHAVSTRTMMASPCATLAGLRSTTSASITWCFRWRCGPIRT